MNSSLKFVTKLSHIAHLTQMELTHSKVMSHVLVRHVSQVRMSHVTHMNGSCHTHLEELCHTYDKSIRMSHVTRTNESCHTCALVMSHVWRSPVTHTAGPIWVSICYTQHLLATENCQDKCYTNGAQTPKPKKHLAINAKKCFTVAKALLADAFLKRGKLT